MTPFKTTCEDGQDRKLFVYLKEPITASAHVMIYGKSVTGKVVIDKQGYRFIPNVSGKNRGVWDDPESCSKMAERRRLGDS